MKVQDPFAGLQVHHDTAVLLALRSDAAAYIRFAIAEHLAEIEDLEDGDTSFLRGYRMALRVTFLVAGGDVDGSEDQWAQVVEAARG